MSDSVRIKVTTEELKKVAGEADTALSDMRKKVQAMETAISRTYSYWIGNAGDQHRMLYTKQKEKTEDVLKRWTEHPKHLREIAGLYETIENESSQQAASLMGDIIE